MSGIRSLFRETLSLLLPSGLLERAPALAGTRYMAKAAFAARFGGKSFTMVNVGACDGVLFDDMTPWLRRIKGARAVLVEPVPYNSRRLRENYPDADRFIIEQVAITRERGRMTIKTFEVEALENGTLPAEFVGCSSVTDTNLVSGKNAWGEADENFGQFAPYLADLDVDTATFDDVMERNRIDHIDALLIDCEGADWMVFDQVDLERFRPGLIKIEVGALGETDIGKVIVKLKTSKYRVGIYAEDVWAFA